MVFMVELTQKEIKVLKGLVKKKTAKPKKLKEYKNKKWCLGAVEYSDK